MEINFWESPDGRYPVRDFIAGLDVKSKKKLFQKIELFEEFPIGHLWRSEDLKKFDDELSYFRILFNKTYYRIFCTMEGQICILLHIFIKKSNKIPPREIRHAKAIWRLYKSQKSLHKL